MPTDEVALVIDGVASQVILWWVTKDRVAVARVDRSRLQRIVVRLNGSPECTLDEVDAALLDLRRLLIGPHGSTLFGIRRLVVVPDVDVMAVPFAALADLRGRRLDDDRTVVYCASVAQLPCHRQVALAAILLQ